MIFVDELKNMVLYKKPFFLPINESNKRKGAATFLLTPDYNSSNKAMNLPYIIKRYYNGYYIEKDITYYINQENTLERPYEDYMVLNESIEDRGIYEMYNILENVRVNDKGEKIPEKCTECGSNIAVFIKGEPVYLCVKCNKFYGTVPFKNESSYLSSKERNSLDDSEFGLPKQRKYPLHDEKHVKSAIKFFNYVDEEDEKELAENIIKRMEEYDISSESIGDENRLKKYVNESSNMVKKELPICTLRCSLMNKYKEKGIDCREGCDQYKKRVLNKEV